MTTGITSFISQYSVSQTVERVISLVEEKGFTVVATVPHSKAATNVGLALNEAVLILFGNPKVGTLLMQSQLTAGLDLPLKVLVYKNHSGEVNACYTAPSSIAEKHGIDDRHDVIDTMTQGLATIVNEACK